MKSIFKTLLLSKLLVLTGSLQAQVQITHAVNHWLANTSGGKAHIQNFIEDMNVYYHPDTVQYPRPLVITKSFWDEGSCGYCSYFQGQQVGKAEWWKDKINSRITTRNKDTCQIINFYGRAFLNKISPPPQGDSAPCVVCTGHDTIFSVEDPTAVTFDLAGNLLIADNGPDQNVKIFDMSKVRPALIRTFGESGGVFAGPVSGSAGVRRFWGIRGLGVDSSGNIYIGNTGIPMQTMGGTDIRVFSAKDSILLWQVQGLSFVNSADADPLSDGRSVFLNAKRFVMDWNLSPGKSWHLAAVTLDPFRYPHDPRLVIPSESVYMRRIGGKLFQFSTNMTGDFLSVHRFVDSSEIAIPTAFFCLRGDNFNWLADSVPKWEHNETNKRTRWYWIDNNGDGFAQKTEFGTYENANIYSQSFDIDEQGHIWSGGSGSWSSYYKDGGLLEFPIEKLNSHGVPMWRMDSLVHHDIPFPKDTGDVNRLKYFNDQDIMYLTLTHNYFFKSIRRYDHWSDPEKRKLTASFDLGYDDRGISEIKLDQNTDDMVLPMSFTADNDYVYVAYLDNGRDAHARGEITIYDAHTGRKTGWIIPGPDTENFSGAIDLLYAINVRTRNDGSKVIFVEEDGKGKVMAYNWKPQTEHVHQKNVYKRNVAIVTNRNTVIIRGDGVKRAKIIDLKGRVVFESICTGINPDNNGILLPVSVTGSSGIFIIQVETADGNWSNHRISLQRDISQ